MHPKGRKGRGRTLLVSSPDPTPKRRKESGDIGADSWFCKLSSHVIICIYRFVLEHVRSRDGAQDQEKASNVPRPFPRVRDGVWERD